MAVIRDLPSRSLTEWHRATRNLCDGINIMDKVHKRGAYIKLSDRPDLDLSTPTGQGILALLSGLAEKEHHRILQRAGLLPSSRDSPGRNPKLNAHQRAEAKTRREPAHNRQDFRRPSCDHCPVGKVGAGR